MKRLLFLFLLPLAFFAANGQPITDTGTLRTYINSEIVTNGTKAITAVKLNRILNGYLNVWPRPGYGLNYGLNGVFSADTTILMRRTGWTPNRVPYTNNLGNWTVSDLLTFDGNSLNIGNAGFGGTNYLNINGGRGYLAAGGGGWRFGVQGGAPFDASKKFWFTNVNKDLVEIGSYDPVSANRHYVKLHPGVEITIDTLKGVGDRNVVADATGKLKIGPGGVGGSQTLQQTFTNGYNLTGNNRIQHNGGGEVGFLSGDSTLAGAYSQYAQGDALVRIIQQEANGNYAKISMSSAVPQLEAYTPAASARLRVYPNGVIQRQMFPSSTLDTMATQAFVRANAGPGGSISVTPNRVIVSDGTGAPSASTVTNTQLGYLTGAASNIQDQINTKLTATTLTPSLGQVIRFNGSDWVNGGIQASDVPTLNQNTTGTAANVTGTVSLANGGTGATDAATARANLATGQVVAGNINRIAIYAANGSVITNHGALTGSRVMTTDGSGLPNIATTTATEINYVSGVTSAIQTQLNNKQAALSNGYGIASLSGNTVRVDTFNVATRQRIYKIIDSVATVFSPNFTGIGTAASPLDLPLKTVNGNSLYGSGDISISGGSSEQLFWTKQTAIVTGFFGNIQSLGAGAGNNAGTSNVNTAISGTYFQEQFGRAGQGTGTTPGTVAKFAYPLNAVYKGNGTVGGYVVKIRFGVYGQSANSIIHGGLWTGAVNTNIPATTDISSAGTYGLISVGKDSADVNWHLFHSSGGGTVTKVDTGIPVRGREAYYDLTITTPSGGNPSILFRDLTGTYTNFTHTITTNQPGNFTVLGMNLQISNNSSPTNMSINFSSARSEMVIPQ